jgi:hypothetical protein
MIEGGETGESELVLEIRAYGDVTGNVVSVFKIVNADDVVSKFF